MTERIPFTLKDTAEGQNGQVTGWLEIDDYGINFHFDGYGTRSEEDEASRPLYLEYWDGKLMVHGWTDINDEDPETLKFEEARVERFYGDECQAHSG